MSLMLSRHVSMRSFLSAHFNKIKEGSVSTNLPLTFDIAEENED